MESRPARIEGTMLRFPASGFSVDRFTGVRRMFLSVLLRLRRHREEYQEC
ncbi:MAG: hypothetical protein RLY31_459 [Bacteroidota bacterium]